MMKLKLLIPENRRWSCFRLKDLRAGKRSVHLKTRIWSSPVMEEMKVKIPSHLKRRQIKQIKAPMPWMPSSRLLSVMWWTFTIMKTPKSSFSKDQQAISKPKRMYKGVRIRIFLKLRRIRLNQLWHLQASRIKWSNGKHQTKAPMT